MMSTQPSKKLVLFPIVSLFAFFTLAKGKKGTGLCCVAVLLFLTSLAQPVPPGPTGTWHLLGTIPAQTTMDHASIPVAPPFDHILALQLQVSGAPLSVVKLMLFYADGGEPTTVPMRLA